MSRSQTHRSSARRIASQATATVLVAGGALAAFAVATSSAQAATLSKSFTYSCDVNAGGLPLGAKSVGVKASVDVPDSIAPGDVLPSRTTSITLSLPDDLKTATTGLLGGKSASGAASNVPITFSSNGASQTATVPTLSAKQTDIPATGAWTIDASGTVPAITTPTTVKDSVVIGMPAAFTIAATVYKDTTAATTASTGTVSTTLACSLSGDLTLGSVKVSTPTPTTTAPTTTAPTTAAPTTTAPTTAAPTTTAPTTAAPTTTAPTTAAPTTAPTTAAPTTAAPTTKPPTTAPTTAAPTTKPPTTAPTTAPPTSKPNQKPVAKDLSVTTSAGKPVTFTVQASDPDGDKLTFTGTAPKHGTVDGSKAPTATYTPESGFTGTDSFTYTVSDGKGGTATATVTITVTKASDGVKCPMPGAHASVIQWLKWLLCVLQHKCA